LFSELRKRLLVMRKCPQKETSRAKDGVGAERGVGRGTEEEIAGSGTGTGGEIEAETENVAGAETGGAEVGVGTEKEEVEAEVGTGKEKGAVQVPEETTPSGNNAINLRKRNSLMFQFLER
jgi:hypothetical protein